MSRKSVAINSDTVIDFGQIIALKIIFRADLGTNFLNLDKSPIFGVIEKQMLSICDLNRILLSRIIPRIFVSFILARSQIRC